jgi:hypothetical protein
MDTGIIFAVVLAVLFLGGIAWLVIYSNRRVPQKNLQQTSIKVPETKTPKRAA